MTLKKQSVIFQAIEVVLFSLAIIAIGYYFSPEDPLLIHKEFSFLVLWLAIVTLFYGIHLGLLMWIVFAIVSFFNYANDNIFTSVLLENLFFVFLYGIFFSNLHDEMNKYKIKSKYLQLRLKELTNAFFTLKISHDKLESVYIIQPASFRFVISEILESSNHSIPKESAKNTLRVLQKFFSVNAATIWRVKHNIPHHAFASIGEIEKNINIHDKLIQEALLQKRAIYLNDLEDKEETSYLYAIPFMDKRDEIVAILIVKEIPFLFYHEDTLLKINVVFNYIWTEYKKRASLDRIQNYKHQAIELDNKNHIRQDIVDFKLEIVRLTNIFDDYNIDSRIYSITTKSKMLDKEIKDFLYQNELLEILDQYISITCHGQYVHIILFPLVSNSAIHNVTKNLDEKLEMIEGQQRIQILNNSLKNHLSEENYEGLNKKNISVSGFNDLLKEYNCV